MSRDACSQDWLKVVSRSGLLLGNALERVEKGVKAKVSAGLWDVSLAEIAWLMKRMRESISAAADGGGNNSEPHAARRYASFHGDNLYASSASLVRASHSERTT